MPEAIPSDPSTQLPCDAVFWRDDGTPASPRFGDIYRSAGAGGDAGLAQARQVFLQGCGLLAEAGGPPLWQGAAQWRVLETGFGLGLNFLATWRAWQADAERPTRLHYVAIEAWPVTAADVLRSAAPFADLAPLAAQLAGAWRGLLPGFHRLVFEDGRVQLTLCIGEVQPMLRELDSAFDAIFLDGFAPTLNPDMWSVHTLKGVARLARRGARAATWCVAREVRERLEQCGFAVTRVSGVPPKRHSLRAVFQPHWPIRRPPREALFALPSVEPPHALIVGGGIAGAACADSLARRGWRVTVLDAAAEPAAGASGLPAGVVAPHVSPDDRPVSRLTRVGAHATLARAAALLVEGEDFAASGVLELPISHARQLPPGWSGAGPGRDWTHPADAAICQIARAAPDAAAQALWHAQAGWIRPAALVRALLAHPAITWQGGVRVQALRAHSSDSGAPVWQALDAAGRVLAQADVAILAAGPATPALLAGHAPPGALPINPLRGQVALGAMPTPGHGLPPFPVNGNGSLIAAVPSDAGPLWVTGATFERAQPQALIRPEDHAANLQRLRALLPEAAAALAPQFDAGTVHAWAGVRATVPDRLPAIGPLLADDLMLFKAFPREEYAPNAINTEANQPSSALWLCTAMGARGLTLGVLAGELIAAWLNGEPLPVERSLAARLRAGRWLADATEIRPEDHQLHEP